MAKNNVIQLVIQAKNEASAVLKAVEKDMGAIQKNAASGGSGVAKLATPAAVVAFGVAIAATANEAAKSAAQYERLERSTNSLGAQYGMTSNEIIAAVNSVAKGTLSNATILEQANKAMLLGVADSEEEFTTLTKIAIDRGRAMGISMEHAFNSIVLGVGRLSPLILDNLGIILDADTTYGNFAKTIGKTADALTDAEKRQALLGRLKEEMGGFDPTSVLDTASAWEQLGAQVENANIRFGEWLNNQGFLANALRETSKSMEIGSLRLFGSGEDDQVQLLTIELDAYKNKIKELEEATSNYNNNNPLTKFFTDISQNINLNALEEARKGLAETYEKLAAIDSGKKGTNGAIGKEFEEAARAATAIADAELKTAIEQERVNTLTREYQKLTGMSKAETENLVQSIIKISPNIGAAIAQLDRMVGGLQAAQAAASAVASAMGGAYSALESAAVEAYKNSGFSSDILGTYQQQLSTLQGVEKSLIAQGVSAEMLPFAVAQATDGATDYFDAINKAATATGSAGSATKQLTQEFSSLKGNVEGIFSNLFSDIGGVSVDDFLPREDAPNEAARRIADVMVKGFESPWAEYFQSSFPDLFSQYMGSAGGDVKTAAAQLLRDFQSGLRPELIDTNAVKEIAKKMFQADAATSAMIDQVAQELAAEMGISIEKATGYASGAAGKKVVDQDAIDAAKKALTITPTFNFGSASTDLMDAGKAAGFFTSDGTLEIPTTVKISSTALDPENLPKAEIEIIKFALGKTKEEFATEIAGNVGGVNISTNLNLPKSDDAIWQQIRDAIKLSIGGVSIPTVLAIPTIGDVEGFKQQIMTTAGVIGIPITFTGATTLAEDINALKMAIFNQLTAEEQMTYLAQTFSTNLGVAMSGQATQMGVFGTLLGTYIYQGFSQYQIGTILASELSRQVGEAQASFEASGKTAGKKWGDAFLNVVGDNVPFELLQILIDLITPEVQKRLVDEGTRK
jgi:replicative DNA helicase